MGFTDGLGKGTRLGIIMLRLILAVPADVQADGEGHGHRIGIFQGDGAFQPDDVIGQGDVVIGPLHGLFHHFKLRTVFPAEADLGRVHEDEFIGGAGAADGVDGPVDAHFGQFTFPVSGIGDQGSVRQPAKAFGDGENGDGGVQFLQDFLEEPVYAERGNAADNEVGAFDRFLPVFIIVILETLI
jgi:hypothetical protein